MGTVQTIQFADEVNSVGPPLRSRTSDGLEVHLETSFQYQLNVSTVYRLYHKFGAGYESVFAHLATDLISANATKYTANEFFEDRNSIGLKLESELKKLFSNVAFADIAFFQLRSVSLPSAFEEAIQLTEVKKQDIRTAMAERDIKEVAMTTQVLQAQQEALAIGFKANATAQAKLLNMEAFVQQYNLAQRLQAESFAGLKQKLGDDEMKLLEYMRTRAMRDHPQSNTVVSLS
eukprot:NODE_3263_length_809_cov_393.672414.p1 GENE.NODE_3263_length_809_cov_393.672414~~NODE_3263_length_809_cov_393.672414.p1  ORF type:complete len:233 (+),score=87.18 NODE_3263_length_809_cov_393.672414:3-701(+)